MQNIEFTTGPDATGTVLPAWIESGASSTSTSTIIWVKLPNGIGADSSMTIYLNFMPSSVMSSSGPTGEAPQLSSTYGEYDDIASVMQPGLIYQIYYDSSGSCDSTSYQNNVYAALLGDGVTISSCASFVSSTGQFVTSQTGTTQDVDGTNQPDVVLNYQEGYSGGSAYPNPPVANNAYSWIIKTMGWADLPDQSVTFYGMGDDGIAMGYATGGGSSSGQYWLGGTSNPNNVYNGWRTQGATTYSGTIPAGAYRIEQDYFEDGGGAYTALWSNVGVNYYHAAYPPDGVMPSASIPPASVPPGIVYYTQLSLSTSWNVGHGAFVQQMVNITESSFSNYIVYNNNFANFEYFYANGTIIPAWIESNINGKLITWVRIKNTTTSFYLGFASQSTNLLSSSGTTGIGEAPQLSGTYAEYDDGSSVFPYYQRFGGLSSLPSGWSSVSGTQLTYYSTYLKIQCSQTTGEYYGIFINPMPSPLSSTPTVWDFYGSIYDDGPAAGNQLGTSTATPSGGPEGNDLYGYTYLEGCYSYGGTNLIYFWNNNAGTSTGVYDPGGDIIYTMVMNSPTSVELLLNYTSIYSTTSATSEAVTYFGIYTGYAAAYPSPAPPAYAYWVRARTDPPNGVMPSVSFGSV
ncbi:MAG: DUF2341 domain-containing protein [Candidatus Micrarchaeia archaeon]